MRILATSDEEQGNKDFSKINKEEFSQKTQKMEKAKKKSHLVECIWGGGVCIIMRVPLEM